MKGWLAANLFLLAFVAANVGAAALVVKAVQQLNLEPMTDRIATVSLVVAVICGVGLVFKHVLERINRR